MKLVRLIYKSHSTQAVDLDLIIGILIKSQFNNQEMGLTGALLFNKQDFLQVLEGPEKAINQLFAKIQQDERNTDVTLLSYQPCETRYFQNWSMKAFEINALTEESSDFIRRKYNLTEEKIELPEDPFIALSLVLDVAHLKHSS